VDDKNAADPRKYHSDRIDVDEKTLSRKNNDGQQNYGFDIIDETPHSPARMGLLLQEA
jgi:hypothetical protein